MTDQRNISQAPAKTWINGDYRVPFGKNCPYVKNAMAIVHVDDGGVTFRQLRFLDSESQAYQPMSWVGGGGDNHTVMITLNGETAVAVVSEDKKTITGGPGLLAASGCPMVWLTPAEAEIINR